MTKLMEEAGVQSTGPHVPALTSTAPRRNRVSKVKQRNGQIEVMKLEIFPSLVGAWIANAKGRQGIMALYILDVSRLGYTSARPVSPDC